MKKPGTCDHCKRESQSERYEVENNDGGFLLCEPCFFEWERVMTEAWKGWFHRT